MKLGATQTISKRIDHATGRRQDAQSGKSPGIEHWRAIDQDLELAVWPSDDFHFSGQLASHSCRHTDGMQAGDSVGAGPDLNSSHVAPSVTEAFEGQRRSRTTSH